ncbi:sigma-70 family RNA polymerase sigma factor [Cognatishimia sp.]|uniref:sigma-70 family RNA polymerase sigma factor n=1 Tax=Cognatishimia sp. TaxID=2211648 RepID=UPI0035151ED3|nr:sigma-70 family RNA polymerase sigma factor [Cognatishimia sp.]
MSKKISIDINDEETKKFLKKLNRFKVLDREEEYYLIKLAQEGDKSAERKVINHNIRLVVSIVKKYTGKGVAFLDLVQEGCLMLAEAIQKFDVNSGNKFSTYCNWWVKKAAIIAVTEQPRPIRVPPHMSTLLGKYKRAYITLEKQIERSPTDEEMMLALDLTKPKHDLVKESMLPLGSLSDPVASEEGCVTTLQDTLSNTDRDIEKDRNDKKQELIKSALSKLTPKEAQLVTLKFGLDGKKIITDYSIARCLKIKNKDLPDFYKNTMDKLKVLITKSDLNWE